MGPMKILQLAQARVRLWAGRPGESPFEVTKVVGHPLQPLCAAAPRCPTPEGERFSFRPAFSWIDPLEAPSVECPYRFELRGDCLTHRNQLALEAALFDPHELDLTRRLLEAVGFEVHEDPVDPVADNTILLAHGHLGPSYEVRLMHSPVAGPIVLVREHSQHQRSEPMLRLEGVHTR